MKKIDFNIDIKDLKGEPTNIVLKEVVANLFAYSKTDQPAKYLSWANSLIEKGTFEADDIDLNKIKEENNYD